MDNLFTKQLIAPIIIIIVAFLLSSLITRIVKKALNYKVDKNYKRQKTIIHYINNIIRIVIFLIAILMILEIFNIDTKSLVASLGVFSLVAGLALQDTLKDLIAGFSIVFEGHFVIGDWVSIGDFRGEVIVSNLRTTKLKAYTGEIKTFSNRNIVEFINYTQSKSISIVDVNVSYNSDVDKVQDVLDKLCEVIKKDKNLEQISCVGINELSSSSIVFRIVAMDTYQDSFAVARYINKQIIKIFKEKLIEIPYPQVVIHNGKRL